MTESQSPHARRVSVRRLALTSTAIAALAAGALLIAPSVVPRGQNVLAQSQNVARPVGFADIVERVKPAVISVRVKSERPQANVETPFPPELDEFFRRGAPNQPRRSITGQGSGFFISADGYAVTNYHVVDKATSVEVRTDDGKTYTAKVIGVDQRTDLALIKVDGGPFPYARFSDRVPRVGDWVIAVGNPFGLGGTVTAGIVSARGRDIGSGPYDDYIQIDAPVNKGNSGGPTFDVDGGVIGVNTAIFSPSGGSVGIAFAIPAETVKTVVAQLREKGSVLRGWIGVSVRPITPDLAQELNLKRTEGAFVAEPQPNSPAEQAGIQRGDVILSVNGTPVKDSRDLAKRIGNMSPGTKVNLVVWSKGAEKNLSLTLGELPNVQEARAVPFEPDMRPPRERDNERRGERRRFRDQDERGGADPDQRGERRDFDGSRQFGDRRDDFRDRAWEFFRREFGDRFEQFRDRFSQRGDREFGPGPRAERGEREDRQRLGLSLQPGGGNEGVMLAAVEPNSRAAELGFKAGDVIVEVDGKAVSSPQDVREALRNARADGKNSVTVRVKSQEGTRTITIPLRRA
jgi:serine protease Do